jgi:hypothetical protein
MQLELPWLDAGLLHGQLEQQTGLRVTLVLTDNTSTLMSIKHERLGQRARVRLHQMFLSAPPQVVKALAGWIKSPRSKHSGGLLDQFIRENSHQIRRGAPRARDRLTRGDHFDLRDIFDGINQAYFSDGVTATIGWGRMPSSRRRRSIRFGGFFPRENLIRIHPLLDQAFVPFFFVRYIVFHEMLHALVEMEEPKPGRRRIHCGAFKGRERSYPDYARAVAWENNPSNLRRLLGRR